MNSPAGVPVASPRTVTWLPATRTSLMIHFRSGTDLSRCPTPAMTSSRLVQTSLPRQEIHCGVVACLMSSALSFANLAFRAFENGAPLARAASALGSAQAEDVCKPMAATAAHATKIRFMVAPGDLIEGAPV